MSFHIDNERNLVRRAQEGDAEAFCELVEIYQDRLFNAVYRMVGNADDAADLVQEAFVKAYRGLDRFRLESRFSTWLYRIAMNGAISHRRRPSMVSRAVSLSGGGGRDEAYRGGLDPEDPAADPTRPAAAAEKKEAIVRAIESLGEDERALVVLRDVDGRSYDEIAEILDVPLGTVRSRLHRARLELRRKLRSWMED